MGEIPEDVLLAAEAALENVKDCVSVYAFDEGDGYVCSGSDWEDDDAVNHIARAILAERKRCAACCDSASPGHYAVVASNIRAAIESGQ